MVTDDIMCLITTTSVAPDTSGPSVGKYPFSEVRAIASVRRGPYSCKRDYARSKTLTTLCHSYLGRRDPLVRPRYRCLHKGDSRGERIRGRERARARAREREREREAERYQDRCIYGKLHACMHMQTQTHQYRCMNACTYASMCINAQHVDMHAILQRQCAYHIPPPPRAHTCIYLCNTCMHRCIYLHILKCQCACQVSTIIAFNRRDKRG